MTLGAFSISLTVKDLKASMAFYEKLGFTAPPCDDDQKYAMMVMGDTVIGLFEGMFDQNILTFNPGWTGLAEEVNPFDDVRQIQAQLEAKGLKLEDRTDPGGAGPGSIMLRDPDGNPILIDQHR